MKIYLKYLVWASLWIVGCQFTSDDNRQIIEIPVDATPQSVIQLATEVRPTKRQITWQSKPLSAIIYFGLNTYLDLEVGDGSADAAIFNPLQWNAEQWVNILQEAGFERIMITAKHYDGFCLWPSETTDYDIGASPFRNGQGDIIKELSEACHRAKIDFGLYYPLWDRHDPNFGNEVYNEFVLSQLEELMTDYGIISEVWLDGTNGDVGNAANQVFDWAAYFETIRKYQPDAVISIKGPDARWIGTENGLGRETEWCVVPIQSSLAPALVEDNTLLIPLELNPMASDLNNQNELIAATHLAWYPAEVNIGIRPGRFYHPQQDELVKSAQQLLDIYLKSIGRNTALSINIPVTPEGTGSPIDLQSLEIFQSIRDQIFKNNRLKKSAIEPSSSEKPITTATFTDQNSETYWAPLQTDESPTLTISYNNPITFNILEFQEPIEQGQLIESFVLEVWNDTEWIRLTQGTTIGNRRLISVNTTTTEHIRLIITASRGTPKLSEIGVYKNLPEVLFEPKAIAFTDNIVLNLTSDDSLAKIHYTIDGSIPDAESPIYQSPLILNATTEIKAIPILPNGLAGYVNTQLYNKARFKVLLENAPDIRFTSGGSLILTDGLYGGTQFDNNRWLGFREVDLSAIIDLNSRIDINKISVNFLQNISEQIHLPNNVKIYASNSLKNWRRIANINIQESTETDAYSHTITQQFKNLQYRYLKIVADNIGMVPQNEVGEGNPAWLFIDEISIE